MTYYYSTKNDAFYPAGMEDVYREAGTWPDDGVEVSEEEFQEFSANPPDGKIRSLSDGVLAWGYVPPLTAQQSKDYNDSVKSSLLNDVNQKTQILQTQLLLGIITDADKSTLTTWMKYAQSVNAIDTSSTVDIVWPKAPT